MPPAAARETRVCHPPEYLVRDLTVPWAVRTYVVGPCPETEAPIAGRNPRAPVTCDLDFSASQRTAP
jgi:hypothetical protein